MSQYVPMFFSLASIVGFVITASIFVKKAKETKEAKGSCADCWYQQQIGVVAIMALMVPITLILCCLYGKIIMPTKRYR